MAFGLAVYASQDGLPRHDVRLASGRWSGAIGLDSHPSDSIKRFQSSILTCPSPFPKIRLARIIHRVVGQGYFLRVASESGVSW